MTTCLSSFSNLRYPGGFLGFGFSSASALSFGSDITRPFGHFALETVSKHTIGSEKERIASIKPLFSLNLTVSMPQLYHWGLCESSDLLPCIENDNFTVRRWTLCLPVELSEEETAWFTKWKHQLATIFLAVDRIDCWGESAIRQLLLQPKNVGVNEAYFHQEHVAQISEMYRMLTHLLEDFTTRPEELVMALALRQDAKDANLRYRDEVYGPLHRELKGIHNAMELARTGKGPYPLWIPVKANS